MSLHIELKVDTIELPIHGYVFNDDGYEIVEMLKKAMKKYRGYNKLKKVI